MGVTETRSILWKNVCKIWPFRKIKLWKRNLQNVLNFNGVFSLGYLPSGPTTTWWSIWHTSILSTLLIPRPPPPKAALKMMGNPWSLANCSASSTLATGPGVPGTTRIPAYTNIQGQRNTWIITYLFSSHSSWCINPHSNSYHSGWALAVFSATFQELRPRFCPSSFSLTFSFPLTFNTFLVFFFQSLLSEWLIHFLFLISYIDNVQAFLYSSSYDTFIGQCILSTYCRQVLW